MGRACFPNAVVTGPEATGGEPEMAFCPDFLVERYTGIPGNAAYNHRDTITKVDVTNGCDTRYDATDQSKRLNRYSVTMASSQDDKYEYWMGIYGCTNDNEIMPEGPSSWYFRWAKRTANAWKLDVCGRATNAAMPTTRRPTRRLPTTRRHGRACRHRLALLLRLSFR